MGRLTEEEGRLRDMFEASVSCKKIGRELGRHTLPAPGARQFRWGRFK